MGKEFKTGVSVSLPTSIIVTVDELCKQAGVSRAEFLRKIIIDVVSNKKVVK